MMDIIKRINKVLVKVASLALGLLAFIVINSVLVNYIWDYDGPGEIAALIAVFLLSGIFYDAFTVELW